MAFRIRKRLVAALALVFGLAALAPVVVPLAWRMGNETEIEFHGWRVAVPPGWFPTSREPSLVLARLPWLYPLRRELSYVLLMENPVGALLGEADYQRWKEFSVRREQLTGLRLLDERRVRAAGREARCLAFAPEGGARRVRVECFHPGEALAASFAGHPAHLDAFFSLLGRITVSASQSPPQP